MLFHGWGVSSELANFDPDSQVFNKKEVGLLMLNLMHYMMRRSGLGGQNFPAAKVKMDDIVLGCLRIAYEEALPKEQSVLPFNM